MMTQLNANNPPGSGRWILAVFIDSISVAMPSVSSAREQTAREFGLQTSLDVCN